MNAERLLAIYDRVVDVPEAVPRLRRLIINLAVRGKLVQQDPADEPALDLLERISVEKSRRVKDFGIKGQAATIYPSPNTPFVLPKTWAWISLGTAFFYDVGVKRRPETLESSYWLLELEDIEKDSGKLIKRVSTAERTSKSTKSEFQPGDILYGKLRPYLNKVLVADEPGYSTTEIVAIRPYLPLCPSYCALALRRSDFVEYVTTLGQGTKMPRLRTKDAMAAPFPLAPLAEQHRIVAKVDELMALCDELETNGGTREETRNRLTKASFGRLINPETGGTNFRSSAKFTIKVLPALTNSPDQIKYLRQSILDLAVRGKLVQQDPADEPASELLERITSEKKRLIATGRSRKRGYPSSRNVVQPPFLLPRTWAWARIADIGLLSPRNNACDDHLASFVPMPLIPTEWGASNTHESRPWGEIKKGYTHFAEGDVGLAKITPCFENGKSVVFQNLIGGLGSGTTELHVVRPVIMSANYILLFLKSSIFIETGISKMTGTAGQKRVPKEYFVNSPFPLAPLAEQHRIVAKVDELMALCDQIEANLTTANTARFQLLEAIISV